MEYYFQHIFATQLNGYSDIKNKWTFNRDDLFIKNKSQYLLLEDNLHYFIKNSRNDSNNFELASDFQSEILIDKFNGNKIELNVTSNQEGWLSYIDNWDKGWIVFINGEKSEIYKLFNSYKSINIKKGFSKVKFEYKPW